MEPNFKDDDPTLDEVEPIPQPEDKEPAPFDIARLFSKGKAKVGMPYRPKLKVRIECDRQKSIFQFDVDIPIEVKDKEVLKEVNVKLREVMRRLQLL